MKNLSLITVLFALFVACSPTKKSTKIKGKAENNKEIQTGQATTEVKIYNESRKRIHDLVHTKLEVKFDFEKAQLLGNATLTLTPYFYPSNKIELDAKGMELYSVSLLDKQKNKKDLKYEYDNEVLKIELDKTYLKNDTFLIVVNYLAKPNDRLEKGSSAITSDKGLYFINSDGKDPNKPIQVWTQGETESNSVWFPTIDSPNERMSQEIYITVPEHFVTLSNGILVFSLENSKGTRTDYWKQDKAHAPYLAMMAIGDFAIVKDKWRGLDVNYYVEKEFEPYAREIFGNTPEMMEFYSKMLGVNYPWDKYHQVIVRDYVSGAMENTSAVIFGEFMNKTSRELLDGDNESIIAHELFHHWFGDLVTCESWANLPLNESFATYGEYLWIEHKYGRDAADHHLQSNLNQYLSEAQHKQVDMIRFDYEDKEDMFDSHSYAKGGRILHMLRKYVGDEAFFQSLKLYLTTHKFSSVEIHDLRLAFEKVTGEDLNWFFNQWFLSSGHPELKILTAYDLENKKAIISVEQVQDLKQNPLFRLPMEVDIYMNGEVKKHKITVQKQFQKFTFDADTKPGLINVDAEKMLLCVKSEEKSNPEWVFQFENAPLLMDRYEAIANLLESPDSVGNIVVLKALSDPFAAIRVLAIKNVSKVIKGEEAKIKSILVKLANEDPKSEVRAISIKQLNKYYKGDAELADVYKSALNDSSYLVLSEALTAVFMENEVEALRLAKQLEQEKNIAVLNTIAAIYAKGGDDSHNDFFIKTSDKISGFNRYTFIGTYGKYLLKRSDETINLGLPIISDAAINSQAWWMRMSGLQVLAELLAVYDDQVKKYKIQLKSVAKGSAEEIELNEKLRISNAQKEKIRISLMVAKEKETNETLLELLKGF